MRIVSLLAAATALLFVAMALYTWPLDPWVPVIQLTFTQSAYTSVLNAWSAADLARFRGHFAIDFPFLACYGALGYFVSTRTALFRHLPPRAQSLLAIALPVAAAADAIENALHLYFLYGTAPVAAAPYLAAGVAASAKWLLIVAFVSVAVHALSRKAG